ncbi:hypothetical protein HLB23_30255 [Nocardia uniformis]|uniref:Uncharacterized protein n=1 Tax=Nocardia uniformis TaxID=53432 RepID=A0A849C8M7_9NOCA|nr:hypothetical protein [Nocardia uniformis]NNH74088.1 hypothetical protein [Nocardia uniformis]
MTAAFDNMALSELVGLLTDEEQRDLRPIVLRLVASHGHLVDKEAERAFTGRSLSFTGSVEAAPDFASTSEEVLRR